MTRSKPRRSDRSEPTFRLTNVRVHSETDKAYEISYAYLRDGYTCTGCDWIPRSAVVGHTPATEVREAHLAPLFAVLDRAVSEGRMPASDAQEIRDNAIADAATKHSGDTWLVQGWWYWKHIA